MAAASRRPMIFDTRRAHRADADAIAAAHLDSIRSIGSLYYEPGILDDWGARIRRDLYLEAMDRGEVFWIAVGTVLEQQSVLGFSSHRVDDGQHRTAVYVRGAAARQGVGTKLFQLAEAAAVAEGADHIDVDASLAAVAFYTKAGFVEVGRGEHRLASGRAMPCVFMRKTVTGR